MPRRFPIVQFPNRPLIAAIAARACARASRGRAAEASECVAQLALLVWAAEEVATGANWFRRLLGLAGGVGSALTLRALIPRLAGRPERER